MRKMCVSMFVSVSLSTCFSIAKNAALGVAKNLTNGWRYQHGY
jgi:hypothetical protein